MARLACVDAPALPLQILLLRHPEWARLPAVVVDVDKPQGRVVWANRAAQRALVRPGMRYAAALSIEPGLRAGVVDEVECAAAAAKIVQRLQDFSPVIEPSVDEAGVFWLDASGLDGVFASLDDWVRRIVDSLRAAGLQAAAVVGFTRFGTYAVARQGQGARVLRSAEEERAAAGGVPLDRLRLAPRLRAALDRLGVRDVAALRRLPEGSLLERFGADGGRLQSFVEGRGAGEMLVAVRADEPVKSGFEVEPDAQPLDVPALLRRIEEHLGAACAELASRGAALRALELEVSLDDDFRAPGAPPLVHSIRPAAPTLDRAQILDLVRLRIEAVAFDAPVLGFAFEAVPARASRAQLELFAERPRRDLAAANRALARLRAEFGDGSVVRAVLRDAHLPEATFAWRPLLQLAAACPDRAEGAVRGTLVRRFLSTPHPLPRDHHEPDGWFAAGLAGGAVRRTFGPHVVSGGWWRRRRPRAAREVHRSYHFAETERGDVLWMFYDRARRRWFLQATVE